jgi:hypothetical protein
MSEREAEDNELPANRTSMVTLILVLGFSGYQFGDRNGLNDMPFEKVRNWTSDLEGARKAAQRGNIDLFAGRPAGDIKINMRGELTDANCYLSQGDHAYDHAFCAKFCAATGSPLLFLPDKSARVYVVLTAKDGVPLPAGVLNLLGIPGVSVTGEELKSHGIDALAVMSAGQ